MKRLVISVIALFLAFSVQSSAQVKWGVTGGMSFNTTEFSEISAKSQAGWNAGLTLLVDLPLGFSIQPSLLYHQKNANVAEVEGFSVDQSMGYLELPVSVQWGPDLLVLRPFLDVTPYIGYAIAGKIGGDKMGGDSVPWDDINRFEYGLGVGAGINVWKLQVVARYVTNFGSLYNFDGGDMSDEWNQIKNGNIGGITVNVAFLF